jgi:excisionase family DNA binding protein
MEKIFTFNETCEYLRVKRRTALRWIYSGRLRAFKLGGGRLWWIRERDLRRFIRAGSDAEARSTMNIRKTGHGGPWIDEELSVPARVKGIRR